ncbi:DUF1116 domain-containing protein [Lysinibacter sp. HNR]|uniref:DUF1116 domain-containing protein n=1 Tax=Lysinibacter sp. HNR TaxID=3031408 RepID=UPI002435FAF2|nr:DUF1116 domain-containing protein [Lysinibacter sp. HNR]WGD38096.1 DUF1116 domain-containing protein [Lysinibacter sp. HNR]
MSINDLFAASLKPVNLGLDMFADDLAEQNAAPVRMDWTPPGGGDPEVIAALSKLEVPRISEKIDAANRVALDRVLSAQPFLEGFGQAIDTVPGMTKKTILHAGPPISWERMSGPMKGAVTGALVFEGLASNLDEAAELAGSGEITFSPCHEHQSVGSMAGVTSASMWVHKVTNRTHGNTAYTNLSEQLSKILRFGANDQSVIDRLNWMRDVLGPVLSSAMELNSDGFDLRLMLSQALHMGDEAHNRNVAGTTVLIQALAPYILETDFSTKEKREVFDFVASSDYFSGPTWMVTAKAAMDAAIGVKDSTVVTAMCRNGVDFGIRVSGTGDQWFTGPAQQVIGPMFAGYTEEDSGLDMGDSAITETYGIGGFAMAAAPAIVALVGGTVQEAMGYSRMMNAITTGNNPNVTIPALDFMGVPSGIDVRKVMETGILPIINTAIAHKEPGIGMIGAGIVHPPVEAFQSALLTLAEVIGDN